MEILFFKCLFNDIHRAAGRSTEANFLLPSSKWEWKVQAINH